jgi:hypothetical protein
VVDEGVNIGDYQLLHQYLRQHRANRIVLTFAEIEGILGFSLPSEAWTQQNWWNGSPPVGRRSAHSDAWMLADRTATVNLMARNVVFSL